MLISYCVPPAFQCVILCWCFCFCCFWPSVVLVAYVVLLFLFVCFYPYLPWELLSFLNMKIKDYFNKLRGNLYYVFKYWLLIFIFSFWESSCWATWYWPYVSVVLLCLFVFFQYFSFLLLWLENFQKYFFKFTNSFFCYFNSIVEPVC